MQRLNLAKNKLTQIPHSALSGLAYLETLELSDNPINQINEGDFNGNFLIPQVNLVLFSILSGKVWMLLFNGNWSPWTTKLR